MMCFIIVFDIYSIIPLSISLLYNFSSYAAQVPELRYTDLSNSISYVLCLCVYATTGETL